MILRLATLRINHPKAYINWMLFDEQVKPVTSGNNGSGFILVCSADAVNTHSGTATISKTIFMSTVAMKAMWMCSLIICRCSITKGH
jgi:hypothetical protein